MSSNDTFTSSDLMTVNEVAQYLNVSRAKIHHLAKSGNLPGFKVGQRIWRFYRHQVSERSEAAASAAAPTEWRRL
jgi:excisionase family DNA binding protein